jgi:hypothetical protein
LAQGLFLSRYLQDPPGTDSQPGRSK